MKHYISFFLFTVFACSQPNSGNNPSDNIESWKELYKNKSHYEVNVSDTVKIYHITNSCCAHCLPNYDKLSCLELVDVKVTAVEKNCEGCDNLTTYSFVMISSGSDTIKSGIISPHEKCDEQTKGLTSYVIHVSN